MPAAPISLMSQSGFAITVAGLLAALTSVADAAPRPVTVFLERGGRIVNHQGEEVEIPRYGGGDAAWTKIVGCVQAQFAPFQIDISDTRPRGDHITAIVGGLASQLGLDDRSTNGVGPYMAGRIQRNATVYVFSKVGTGERDTQNVCAVTVHEISHALGLDHTFKCGDVMSYHGDRCGARKFLDVDAPCGEFSPRTCGDGNKTQNSYRMIANLVGLKNPEPAQPEPGDPQDPWTEDQDDQDDQGDQGDQGDQDDQGDQGDQDASEPCAEQDEQTEQAEQFVEDRRGRRYQMERVQGRDGRTWIVLHAVR